jgi:hypothetical protein
LEILRVLRASRQATGLDVELKIFPADFADYRNACATYDCAGSIADNDNVFAGLSEKRSVGEQENHQAEKGYNLKNAQSENSSNSQA